MIEYPEIAKAILDGLLLGIDVDMSDAEHGFTIRIRLTKFKVKHELQFLEVQSYAIGGQVNYGSYIEQLKCFKLKDGCIYFSLDPYDQDAGEDERDDGLIVAKHIRLDGEPVI